MLHKEMLIKTGMLIVLTACLILLPSLNVLAISEAIQNKMLKWQMK